MFVCFLNLGARPLPNGAALKSRAASVQAFGTPRFAAKADSGELVFYRQNDLNHGASRKKNPLCSIFIVLRFSFAQDSFVEQRREELEEKGSEVVAAADLNCELVS